MKVLQRWNTHHNNSSYKMNILSSCMGCMYPGSIRTESIESMDYDNPERRFQVANIDERGHEVSSGEIQLTDNDLIYFRPGRVPIKWPIGFIRRYGCSDNGEVFLFEAGRRSPTGEAIYAFQLTHGANLVNKLRETIEKKSSRINQPLTQSNICGFLNGDSRTQQHHHHHNHHQNQSTQCSNTKSSRDLNHELSNYTDLQDAPTCNSANKTLDDLKPLPYSGINHDMTKYLNELADSRKK